MKTSDRVINWIKEYFDNNGPEAKAIIGISGGKDSTIAAALCVKALGVDRVIGVLMPEGVQEDIEDSYRVCEYLGIQHYEINIDPACSGLFRSLMEQGVNIGMPVVYTNVPARMRMTTLYAVAAAVGGRVCNTSNRCEIYVGYSTKWGDGAGDFGPLREFTVDEVIAMGRELGLPEDLIVKPPADGLSGKTDEENLGFTYQEVATVATGRGHEIAPEHYNKIMKRHIQNWHKVAPIPSCHN
jgi:NAD+ synthase